MIHWQKRHDQNDKCTNDLCQYVTLIFEKYHRKVRIILHSYELSE